MSTTDRETTPPASSVDGEIVITRVFDAPPMTVEQLVIGGLMTHIDEHLGSIRKTVGH